MSQTLVRQGRQAAPNAVIKRMSSLRPFLIDTLTRQWPPQGGDLDLDTDRIDNAALALLRLGLHEGARAWKSFDGDVMARLHEKGFISDPRGKTKSVVFTEQGLVEAERLLGDLFGAEPF